MNQAFTQLRIDTHGPGLYEITAHLRDWIAESGLTRGSLNVFIRHTSASLTIQENADPDVLRDLDDFFRRIVPEDEQLYRHSAEGPDDMPAHIRAALTCTQLTIPVMDANPTLGTWQGVYVFEHRAGRFARNVVLHYIGD